ncbi:MAG: WYL domain-containing protein, partial [Lachnospiraceae bacterium]|nr:WYL domain-containing protein [Lachnospiraceae bacterium]
GDHPYDNFKFETLKTAAIRHQAVKIIYESAGSGRSERTLWPLKLSYKSKSWYLKAFCLERQDFRTFKLNRILNLELLEEHFTPISYPNPAGISPETQAALGMQDVPQIILSFSKEAAYRVYDEFDDTQIERQANGNLIAYTNMPIDQWLIGYLLSFGTQVEILAPKHLKEILAGQAWEIYEKNKP